MLGTVVQKFNAHFTNSRYTLARKPPRSEKPQSIRALWPPRRGFKNRLLMNVPRPGAYKLAPSSREGESKNAVPSKKPNRCCGADTDIPNRAGSGALALPLSRYFPFLSPSLTSRADGLATNCMLSATIALIAVSKRGPLCPLNDL